MIRIATGTERGDRGEDRVAAFTQNDNAVIVLADGAGGTGSGARAAEFICSAVKEAVEAGLRDTHEWVTWLEESDRRLRDAAPGGETTCVIVQLSRGLILGASIGDSGALILENGGMEELTAGQNRKPLLGSSRARPVAFGPRPLRGRLLVASDGLLKYVPAAVIAAAVTVGALDVAVASLVAAARLPSGKLRDDIAIALCERAG